MRKGTIVILIIIVLLMITGGKSTYAKLVPKQADIKEGSTDLAMNKSDIEDSKSYHYENTKKPVLEISYNIDMEPKLREVILNYYKTDLRLGKPFEEPQIISYWKVDDTQYRVKTAGYYSFGFIDEFD